jgi:hypothetical protein
LSITADDADSSDCEQSPRRPGLSLSAARRKRSHAAADYFIVKQNQTANPIGVRLFRSQTVMLEPDRIADLVEEFGLPGPATAAKMRAISTDYKALPTISSLLDPKITPLKTQ